MLLQRHCSLFAKFHLMIVMALLITIDTHLPMYCSITSCFICCSMQDAIGRLLCIASPCARLFRTAFSSMQLCFHLSTLQLNRNVLRHKLLVL